MEINGNLVSRYHNNDTLIRSFLFLIFPAFILKSLTAEPYQDFCFNVSNDHFLSSQFLKKNGFVENVSKESELKMARQVNLRLCIFCRKKNGSPPPPASPSPTIKNSITGIGAGFLRKATCEKKQRNKRKSRTNFRGSRILSTF